MNSKTSVIRRYPAFQAQRGFWFLHELAPESAAYNVISAWRIQSRLDVDALQKACACVTGRHESTRTTFRVVDGVLMAEVRDRNDGLVLVDAAGWDPEELLRQVADEAHRPFDLESGPVSRPMLFSISPENHVLLVSAHHIAADGWSNLIFMKELGVLYDAHAAGLPPSLKASGPTCEEFAQWQADQLAGPDGERLWSYWREQLAGELPGIELPADRPRKPVRRHHGAYEIVALDSELTTAVRLLASSHSTTPFVILLAVFQSLLARYTGQDDIVVGSIAHGRTVSSFRRTFGNLMNQIVLRTDLSGEPSFTDVVRRTRETVRAALAHQAYPFPLLVERLAPARDPGRSALCDVTFSLTYLIGEGRATVDWGQLSLTALPVPRRASQGDLDVQLVKSDHGMALVFQYDTDLFEAETIRRMGQHYLRLLRAFVESPTQRISEAPLLGELERARLIAEWTQTAVEWAGPSRIETLVESQVDLAPEAPALSGGGRRLSYRALDERANQVAHRLRRMGVGPDTPVAICVERSPDLVVGLLGILKAGGGYVPLDPTLPPARLAFAIEDAGARVIVTEERFQSLFPACSLPTVLLDGDQAAALDDEPVTRLVADEGRVSHDRAYITYTSGSSGIPKGVEIEHRSVVNVIQDLVSRLRLGPGDVWTAITSVAFDVASLEIWGALAAGARLDLVEPKVVTDGASLAAAVRETGTTVLLGTPTLWRVLLDSGWPGQPGLKMICGGESLNRGVAEALLQRGAELWNQYGPTEATMYATTEQVTDGEGLLTIGRAIANVRTYVLDARGEPVPIGVAGELWIGGVQVARGYLNRPEENTRSFVADPWVPGERRYRTGDLGRYRADGRFEFIGRLDTQVKIRGYRVELGEIETVIGSHPAILSATALAPGRGSAAQRLAAYLVVRAGESPPIEEDLRVFLGTRLPVHMIPSDFILVDALPVTSGGKTDRRALAATGGTPLERGALVTAPRTGLEDTLALIWASVLERTQVGVHDNFFELGGHSLLATQVISRIQQTFQVDLAVRDLFEAPTVAGLAGRITARVRDGRSAAPAWSIQPRAHIGPAPLSFSQERMWFLHQLAPDSAAYNVPAAIRVRGPLNIDALEAALHEIVRRHEILRTIFPAVNGRPVQVVTDRWLDLDIVDLRTLPAGIREGRARELCQQDARRPFDLERGPVLRSLLMRLDQKDHVLLLSMHHIVCDQWSFRVLGRELISLYDAYCSGRPSSLESLPIQFGDFASWQRQWLVGPVLDAQLAYWRRHLAGTLPVLELPADRTRPATPSYEGGLETRRLASGLMVDVETLSRQEQASVFMTLMAAFTAVLARYSGQDDFILGVPIANRNHVASEDLIGDLVNTLPIRTDVSGDPTFRTHLRKIRNTLLDAYAHQDMPFDRLVLELQPTRYTSHSPLVRVMMNLLNVPMPRQRLTDLDAWEPFLFDRGAAQFDLTLTVDWDRGGWVNLEYSSDLFDRAAAARMVDHFEVILRGAMADPDCRLSEIPLLTEGDRDQLLVAWNRTSNPAATDVSIQELFEVQVDRTPDAIAVTDAGGSLTYRELDRRANRLARYLQALGVSPESTVGVCLERSRMTFVALLAVLKANGAFVPLDPSYPTERLAFMLADSGARVLVTDKRNVPAAVPTGTVLVLLDADRGQIERQSEERITGEAGGDRLAYIIYTSGSTGTPKGVLGQHRGAVNRFRWMWRAYPFGDREMCCQKTSAGFVDSIWETFGPLLHGVPITVIPDEVVREPQRLIRMLRERQVTRIAVVPSLLQAMIQAEPELGVRLPHLRLWVSSGEVLGRDLARRFREVVPRGILLNLYGSSEAAGDSTFHEVRRADALTTVPIGRPIDNTEIYILDRSGQPVPIGITGELFIAGDGLARGYLNRPELTLQKFVPNPFSGQPEGRMYRTGDRARYRSDGTIEYLGRRDSQVKVRGFRIELGEVESALSAHPDVASAVAVAREENVGDCRLVGYVVATNGTQLADIFEFLRRRLPGYLVPSALVLLESLPLTPNGKVDRQALPAPEYVRRHAAKPPRTATEATLSTIWADLLGVPEIGVHDNFFEFGGHSLLAAQVVARIEEVFRTTLPLRSLFDAPTVAQMAALIEAPVPAGVLDSFALDADRVEIDL